MASWSWLHKRGAAEVICEERAASAPRICHSKPSTQASPADRQCQDTTGVSLLPPSPCTCHRGLRYAEGDPECGSCRADGSAAVRPLRFDLESRLLEMVVNRERSGNAEPIHHSKGHTISERIPFCCDTRTVGSESEGARRADTVAQWACGDGRLLGLFGQTSNPKARTNGAIHITLRIIPTGLDTKAHLFFLRQYFSAIISTLRRRAKAMCPGFGGHWPRRLDSAIAAEGVTAHAEALSVIGIDW